MEIVGSLTSLLLIFQSLYYGNCHLSVSFEHVMFTGEMKEDNIILSCIIQDNQSDSGESLNVDIIGLIISRRNQNLWKRLAELYNSQPEQVYVSDSGIKNATGSISNDIYLSFLVDNTKKPRFVEYRCDVIVKEINNEGEIRVISSKLSTKMYSSKNRHGNDSVKFLPTRANADVSEVVLSEINEHPVLGKTRLVKRSVDRESNVTDLQTHVNGSKMTFNAIKSISGVKSLDEDYEQMSGKLTDMRSRLRRFKKNMNDSMNKRLLLDIEDKRKCQNIISHLRLQNLNHQAQLKNFSDELKKTLTDILTADQWPSGTYSLLKPSSGCPSSGNVLWQEGFVLFHTESSAGINTDSYSLNSLLSNPIKSQKNKNNFMTFHFCSKSNEDNEELDWPKGSYCINKLGNCSDGFGGGKIHLDQEDTHFQGNVSGIVPWDNTYHDLQFCCRKDGSPMSHITLPRVSDFYLYRYGGRCQNVYGMTFTEEYVLLDTENSRNNDSLIPPHADASIKDFNITLCYYESEV